MLFNSLKFLVFFIIVYSLYLNLNHKQQNRMLLVAGCVFYGAWSWKFLFLLFLTTIIDYHVALGMGRTEIPQKRKLLLSVSITANLTVLGFFKYFNFFSANFNHLLQMLGFHAQSHYLLNIILPVGISFYTFQAMGYTIDVYRRKVQPVKNFWDFALFVAFFPQLVAGPIERAGRLIPQIVTPRNLSWRNFYEGCSLIFWGLFQKIFIADNLAFIVNPVFDHPPDSGVKILMAVYAFAFQIYCDFAGYSNIARGLAKCMGFDIMLNFNNPYFSRNPREFWSRWHISLSSWIRDYLYIPLGGNQKSSVVTYRNLFLAMLLAGLWHGAAWNFMIWGMYQAALLILYRLAEPFTEKLPEPKSILSQRIIRTIQIIFFFHLTCLGWLIFRARSLAQIWSMLHTMVCNFTINAGMKLDFGYLLFFTWLLVFVEVFEHVGKETEIRLNINAFFKSLFYVVCFYLLVIYGDTDGADFIYFKF